MILLLLGLKLLLLALPGMVSAGKDETNALLYLSKYGYIPKNAGTEALVTEDNIKEYIKVRHNDQWTKCVFIASIHFLRMQLKISSSLPALR